LLASWATTLVELLGGAAVLTGVCIPIVSDSKECAVMDQQRDRDQLERKLDLCRRLSGAASDPTTSIRLAKLIEELEHSLREGEWWSEHPVPGHPETIR